jgi:hypothetical protein
MVEAPYCECLRVPRRQTWTWGFWCVTDHDAFVSMSPVTIAAEEISTKPGEAFREPVPHLCWLYDKRLMLDPDLPALSKGARVDGHIYFSRSTDYSTSLKSCFPRSRDMYKNQFSQQLSSVTKDVKAVHFCVRYTMRKFSWEPWHKSHSRGQNSCLVEGIQGSPSSGFQSRNRGCQEQSRNPLLGSVAFHLLQHLIYHQRCFVPHFAICSLTGGSNFFYLRIPWKLSLENFLHIIPDDLLFLLDVKNNKRGLIIPQLIV